MKARIGFAVGLMAVALLVGCGTFQGYPLAQGEKVIFNSSTRANAYREWSGNDLWNTGQVVTVTASRSQL